SKTQIAFVYAGDVYVVGRGGGVAQQLTSHPGEELYPKFSPDGNWIAFSAEYSGTRQVYVMPASGGTPRQLTFYADIGALPYRGGRAPDVWVYDLQANTSLQLTNFRGMDMQPSWVGDSVYFASDRDGTLNLYQVAPTGGDAKRVNSNASTTDGARKLTDFHDF